VVFGSRFVGGRDTPDFEYVFSKYTYFRPCGRIWFSSVQQAQRVADEQKERKKERRRERKKERKKGRENERKRERKEGRKEQEEECLVKYKSADILCRAAYY